ncbi:MAG: extracellular solute-binding protein [Lentisphaerae bacterium]|nr:extracellular solute-binding protein [Lentisphaerota bacterium]
MKRVVLYMFLLALLLLLPMLLQKRSEQLDLSAEQLVVISPHNESVRYEIEQAFRSYCQEQLGRRVVIDWRSVGGTSEIIRYMNSAFLANFRDYWSREQQQPWSEELGIALLDGKTGSESPHWPARQAFLQSNIGIDIDLLFGGGQYDFAKQAQAGTLVPSGVKDRHPEWFEGDKPLLPSSGGGERWHDQNDLYYGVCFSSFGICVNLDRLQELGYDCSGGSPINSWADLADPRLMNAIGLADPSKSGSINKCFEMLIQRQMQDTYAQLQHAVAQGEISKQDALDAGWAAAMNLLKRIGGNASYLTFAASKVPVDTAQGQIAAGMCIDFYGRSQAEWANRQKGRTLMLYLTPTAASTVSADPVGLLRGAPNPELAQIFIDFLLGPEAQRLWNYKMGSPGGPRKYSLHRLPVRRDLYSAADRQHMSAPEAEPFELAGSFQYQGAWTGPLFDLMRSFIRVMLIDCEEELRLAWREICAKPNSLRDDSPAMLAFNELPFEHRQAMEIAKAMRSAEGQAVTTRQWTIFFREKFREAARLARQDN